MKDDSSGITIVGATTEDVLSFVRRNVEMFYPSGDPNGNWSAMLVASEALARGARDVAVVRIADWWIIGADFNWISHEGHDDDAVFRRLLPLPEAGINSATCEVVIVAFASAVISFSKLGLRLIAGTCGIERELAALFTKRSWVQAIGFRF